MSSVASTSVRDSWDPNMSSKDTWDPKISSKDTWDPKMSSKDTWDPKISSRDTWDHSKSSRDSWDLSTSARDSLEPRTSVYRNPLQVSFSQKILFIQSPTLILPSHAMQCIDILMTQPTRTHLGCPEFISVENLDLLRSYLER